ncbi:MAG: M17 family peptidase N-terminal domain-containing protein, partial [Mesorhizobium sp.]
MSARPTISFAKLAAPKKGSVLVLSAEAAGLSDAGKACDPGEVLEKAFAITEFTGKSGTSVEMIAPQGAGFDRLVALGVGEASSIDEYGWLKLGGTVFAQVRKPNEVSVVLDIAGVSVSAADAANVAAGILLRAYGFDKYKTKKDDADAKSEKQAAKFTILCADPAAAKKAFAEVEGVVNGVVLARDLVNEPANVLGPVEFADRASELEELGVKVEVLNEKDMKKLGMGALLGVAQGSPRPPRLVVMSWNGGKAKEKPVAFVGKGVVFDTGGNSIKPAAGMEDMKGDMGGA